MGKECFSLVLYLDFNLAMETESAAETSCFMKVTNGNIPVFMTANNETLSFIFRLYNFFVKFFFFVAFGRACCVHSYCISEDPITSTFKVEERFYAR